MRNFDLKIHSPRFDCCIFLFYRSSAATFSTASVRLDRTHIERNTSAPTPIAEMGADIDFRRFGPKSDLDALF